jgi:hypothetical protein
MSLTGQRIEKNWRQRPFWRLQAYGEFLPIGTKWLPNIPTKTVNK